MDDLSQFKDLFLSETEDIIQKLNDDLLALEKDMESQELLDELMRSAHTMKGSSATMGFKQMEHLTHLLEDIFDSARKGKRTISKEIINEVFKALDFIKECLKSIRTADKETDLSEISQKIEKLTKLTGTKTEPTEAPKAEAEAPKPPKPEEVPETKARPAPAKEVEQVSYIKVPVKRLDELMAITEELLTNKMQLELLINTMEKKAARLTSGECNEITKTKDSAEQLDRLISNLQYSVMQARLVPLEQIFARFPRMVRDLAQQENKEIEITIIGGDLELDRTIVDKLGEPIVHLLRNAVDHGITDKGTITLKAVREKDFAMITIEDTGKGIDWGKVVALAVEKNIITDKDSEAYKADLNSEKVKNLLYHPALSTSTKVTKTSGRGVGLSAVKKFMDEVGGSVIVQSPISETGGTRFSLEMPVTLAIVNVLLVKVHKATFAIPFANIEKTVKVEAKNIKRMADQETAIIDGVDVPLVQLDKAFNYEVLEKIKSDPKPTKASPLTAKTVVIVKRGKRTAGLVVDNLLNELEITIKPLPAVLKEVKGFSGTTILGDGKTILIIDIISLFDSLKEK